MGSLAAELEERLQKPGVIPVHEKGDWIPDLAKQLQKYKIIAIGENCFCKKHRVIARGFVKYLREYTLAAEMLWPEDNAEKMSPRELHSLLVKNWGWEYQNFDTAKNYGYLGVILEAGDGVKGIGGAVKKDLEPYAQNLADKFFERRNIRIRNNIEKIQGKVLVYCGSFYASGLDNAAKVIMGKDNLPTYFELPQLRH